MGETSPAEKTWAEQEEEKINTKIKVCLGAGDAAQATVGGQEHEPPRSSFMPPTFHRSPGRF